MTAGRAVVIGASHAGAQLAASLRQEKWAGEIVLIGDESALPYHRPPLSKAYLAGKHTLHELAIRSADFYEKQQIQLLDQTVTSVDPSTRNLMLSNGEPMAYDELALCTGARPRRLDMTGADLPGIYYLRTARDVEAIRTAAATVDRAVIIGGGYIGLEVAASLRALGLDVVLLEAAERVLQRVTAYEMSRFFTRIHREEGVDVRTGVEVKEFSGDHQVREVILADGESIRADMVIIGVGVEPNTDLALAAGLIVEDGVLIDAHARTSDPHITAAGDCTCQDTVRYGRRIRLESVPSATEQAKVAAASMCGKSKEISALPWFWSDQYDLKLQIAGLNTGYDEIVLDGDPAHDRDFTCYYLREGELIAADCVNRPRDFMAAKRDITQGTPVAVDRLATTEQEEPR